MASFALTAPDRTVFSSPYTSRVWRIQDGLPESTVQAIQQSKDGYLWIGTTGGLVRFDGGSFQTYNHATTPALAGDGIFCLLGAHDGSLWIGTEGGGLVRLKDGRFRSFSAPDGLKNNFVRSLMEDHAGRLWVATDRGIFRLRDDRFEEVDTSRYGTSADVHALFEDRDHRVWAGGSHLLTFDPDNPPASMREVRLPGKDSENRVKSILQASDGTMWVGTIDGLDRQVAGEAVDRFVRVPGIAGTVRVLRQTSDGTLWAGTIGHGAYRFFKGAWTHLAAPEVLPSNTVLSIDQDDAQQIWIGTQDGIMRLSKTPVSVVPLPGGSDPDFATLTADPDGSMWVASSRLYSIRAGKAEPFRFPGMPDVPIRNVFRDRDGTMWVGTDGNGVYHLTANGPVHFDAPRSLTNNFARAFMQSRDGAIWVAMDEGVDRILGTSVKKFEMKDGLVYFSTGAILEDRGGDIWIGTENGLSHLHGGSFVTDTATEALAREKVWTMLEDSRGSLWFGTRSGGIFRYAKGKVSHFGTEEGLASNSVYQILEDSKGSLWVSSPNTISSFPIPSLDAKRIDSALFELPYDASGAQMYGGRQSAGSLAADGTLWFPSTKGAVRVVPKESVSLGPPRVLITGIVADGREMPIDRGLVLPASMGRLVISFAPLMLRSQESVRFRYKLEGFDRDWTYARNIRVATYTNIPAGRYKFRVVAFLSGNSAATSEATLEVERKPHFYATWWFLSLCLAALGLAVGVVYQSRVRLMKGRFRLLLAERSRLAREMHDTVIQGCTSVSALLEAISSLRGQDQPLQGDLLDHARNQVRTTIDEARQAVWNLRHTEDHVDDLTPSATAIANLTSKEFGVPVQCEGCGRPFPVRGPVAREMLMVTREAVYNAALHGKPNSIRISLTYRAEDLSIAVSDDGCGFDPAVAANKSSRHYGIAGMRERIQRMEGDLGIESAPQAGTTVSFTIRRSRAQSASIDKALQI
jgi:ligand-binding sensor domain-containing protein/signal transduction histidine kinase